MTQNRRSSSIIAKAATLLASPTVFLYAVWRRDNNFILSFTTDHKAECFYSFFRVKKIPMIAPIRIIGATLKNSHSNE